MGHVMGALARLEGIAAFMLLGTGALGDNALTHEELSSFG